MGALMNSFLFTVCMGLVFAIASTEMAVPNSCNIYSDLFDVGNSSIQAGGNFTGSLPTKVETGSVSSSTSTFGIFIDGIRFILGFINFSLSILFAPLVCGGALGLPIWLQMLLSIPTVIFAVGIVFIIRGGSGGQ